MCPSRHEIKIWLNFILINIYQSSEKLIKTCRIPTWLLIVESVATIGFIGRIYIYAKTVNCRGRRIGSVRWLPQLSSSVLEKQGTRDGHVHNDLVFTHQSRAIKTGVVTVPPGHRAAHLISMLELNYQLTKQWWAIQQRRVWRILTAVLIMRNTSGGLLWHARSLSIQVVPTTLQS